VTGQEAEGLRSFAGTARPDLFFRPGIVMMMMLFQLSQDDSSPSPWYGMHHCHVGCELNSIGSVGPNCLTGVSVENSSYKDDSIVATLIWLHV
jgi:hypothetical protein